MSPVRPEEYNEIVSRVNRKYDGDIRRGGGWTAVPRISTGSIELDTAMGGGIPQGRWTRFYGGFSSTKTLTALLAAKHAQDMGLTVAYYNIEKQFDPKFASEKIGLDTDAITRVEGATVEEIGEKMEALFGVVHMHIVDSCTIAVSEDELNADIRDWRPGITARAWGKVFRRLNERFDQNDNTVILIDQVRTNFKTGGEDPAGGRIFDFQSSMSVSFRRGSWLFRNPDTGFLDEKAKQEKGRSGMVEPAGVEIKCRVEKSRVCRPLRTATLRFDLDELGFDRTFEYVKAAKHYGIVRTTSKGRYEYGDENDPIKFHGDKPLYEFLVGDQELQAEIRETALMAAM